MMTGTLLRGRLDWGIRLLRNGIGRMMFGYDGEMID